jgi:plasmid stabilization system protein ParE
MAAPPAVEPERRSGDAIPRWSSSGRTRQRFQFRFRDRIPTQSPSGEATTQTEAAPRLSSHAIDIRQDREVIRSQDDEFAAAVRDDNQRKREEEEEREKKTQAAREMAEARDLVRRRCETLAGEPRDGVLLCVQLPSGKRLTRKFERGAHADELFALVSNEDELWVDGKEQSYALKCARFALARGASFADQSVVARTMFVCDVDGDEDD